MTSLNRPARLNRSLLIIIGIVLLCAGAFTVLTHFGLLPVLAADSALVPKSTNPPTWAFYVAAIAAVIIGLFVLRWLLAQLTRRPKTQTWRYEANAEQGTTELASATAVAPFLDEVSNYAGVHAAHATLAGTRAAPALAMVISAEQDGDLTEIRNQIDTVGLPRLRQALDLDELPVTIEFRFSARAAARTH